MLASAAGVKFLHVPYRGAAPIATDLIGGRLAFCVTGSTLAAQLIKQGNIHALAVTTTERIPQLPDVPTLVESGYPALNIPSWWALVAAPDTPVATLEKLQQACAAATATPAYKAALTAQWTSSYDVPPARATAFLANERTLWAAAVKQSGATSN
jgi:tripartite-type tricarboxylate transporter receptor subunit TctC